MKHSEIIQEGDPVLHGKAKAVPLPKISSGKIQGIISDMKNTLLDEADGVAIAAPQIGVPLRIFIVSHRAFAIANEEKSKKERRLTPPVPEKELICINPEITKLSKKKSKVPEGCLSVRWLYGKVFRADKATVRAYNENGERFTRGASGLLAQIFQHEIDHLNGILFIDTAKDLEELSRNRRMAIISKI